MILAPTLLLNAGSGAAIARPTFSRDFAGEKTLNNGTGPAITFTRASNATFFDANGTLQPAANDTPRFDHDPATGASRGLLIEEARTNSFERSAEFDNAYWSKNAATITANDAASPSGLSEADRLVETTANSGHFVSRSVSVTSGVTYTHSVFAKAGTQNWLLLTMGAGEFGTAPRAWFDLSSGVAGSTANSPTATSIQSVGNGWYRCSISKAATSTASAPLYISITTGDTIFAAYEGNTANNLLIWGAQLEAGAFPTSYIPTTTAAATRSADSAVVTPISSFYNQAEGTIYSEFSVPAVDGTSTLRGITQFTESGGLDNRLQTGIRGTRTFAFQCVAGGSVEFANDTGGSAWNVGSIVKAASAYRSNDNARSLNGVAPSAISGAITTPTRERLIFGDVSTAGTAILNGHIRKIAYYPRRLSNTLLQQLTT
jgi:hypothetical protein